MQQLTVGLRCVCLGVLSWSDVGEVSLFDDDDDGGGVTSATGWVADVPQDRIIASLTSCVSWVAGRGSIERALDGSVMTGIGVAMSSEATEDGVNVEAPASRSSSSDE